jgi:peptide/nickel transport system substrate-binding protein
MNDQNGSIRASIHRRTLLGGLAGASLVPIAARAADRTPVQGGVLTVLLDPEPPTLLTLTNTAGVSLYTSSKTNEGLLTYDFDLNPKPQLAVSWSVTSDGLEYTFKLRPGVRWHDGKEFTSADVAFSIATLKDVHPRGRGTFANVTDITTPDPLTAVLKLSRPAPYLLTALAASETPIVPRHLLEGQKIVGHPLNDAPVGTGPYRFKEWVRGSHIVYERNPDYWDKPKPYIDRLVFAIMPDAAARSAAVESGAVDLAPGAPVPLSDLDRLKQKPRLKFVTDGYQYINSVYRIEFNLDRPYLAKRQVREAIAHAIDRKQLLQVALLGYGDVSLGPISPNLKRFAAPDLPSYPLDLKRAEQLLDEAGYPRLAGAPRLKLVHDPLPYGEPFRRAGDFIRSALGRIGIEVTIRSQDFATYIHRVYTNRDFDFTFNSMSNLFDPTVGVQRLYWSKNFRVGVPFSNGSHYVSAETDRLLEAAAVETDPTKRLQDFTDFQRQITQDLPDITIAAVYYATIADRKVIDHTLTADGICGNLADVYIDPSA